MALPVATTTVAVTRAQGAAVGKDPADPDYPAVTPVAGLAALRANIGTPTAAVAEAGGTRVVYTAELVTDPADLQARDVLTDADGNTWNLLWAKAASHFGIAVMVGRVELVVGAD